MTWIIVQVANRTSAFYRRKSTNEKCPETFQAVIERQVQKILKSQQVTFLNK